MKILKRHIFILPLLCSMFFLFLPHMAKVSAQTSTGNIWGYKVLLPNNQFNQTPPSGETVTIDGVSPTTSNPYNFGNLPAGNHTVAVSVPTGWYVGYTACINQTNCHTNPPTSGNTATVNVPAGGYVDLWWHFTQATGKVQGYKLDNTGSPFTNPGATITVGEQTFGPNSNPYIANLPSGNATVQSSVPTGFDVYYSICSNCFNHPASSFVKGSKVNVNVPNGGYVDLHWKYVTPSLNSNFSLPTSSSLKQIVTGNLSTEIYQGYANIYAPEVLYDNGIYKMWYGGGGIDIRDRIHYAESSDGIVWTKRGAVVEAPSGSFNANDPSVVKLNGKYYMYMTISEGDLLDKIYLSTSTDGLLWTIPTKVLDKGPYAWNSRYTARPTVIIDNGIFKMWYDTTTGTNFADPVTDINVGYATSSDGINWKKYDQPVFKGYAANDVKKVQGVYVMLIQGAWEGTLIATSRDGINWTKQENLLPPDTGDPTQILGHLTPALFLEPTTGKPKNVYMGAGIPGSSIGYDRNAIYMYSLKVGELEKFLQTTTPANPKPTPTDTVLTPPPKPTTLVNNNSLKIYITPTRFSQNFWEYKVEWSRKLAKKGSLYITRNVKDAKPTVVLSSIASFGLANTDLLLEPNTRYKLEFYSKENKQGTVLARKYFTTLRLIE